VRARLAALWGGPWPLRLAVLGLALAGWIFGWTPVPLDPATP